MLKMKKAVLPVCLAVILVFSTIAVCATGEINTKILGKGKPVVIFDSGYGDGIYAYSTEDPTRETWGKVQPLISEEVKTFAYDRIGIGGSVNDTTKGRKAFDRAHQLHDALVANKVKGPYIYVAHSIAGWTARAFAAEYPDELYGAVFVECTATGELQFTADFLKANFPAFYEAYMAQFSTADGVWEDMLQSSSQVKDLDSLRDKPLTVITSEASSGVEEYDRYHMISQAEQLGLSNKSKQIFTQANHYVMLSDDSGLVVDAVNDMISQYKSNKHNK